MRVVEELRAVGHPVVEFQWSRKTRDSLITKLLAKRSTLAASIYDQLRFRLIVSERSQIAPILAALTRRMIPFNYIVPGGIDEPPPAVPAASDGARFPERNLGKPAARSAARKVPGQGSRRPDQ